MKNRTQLIAHRDFNTVGAPIRFDLIERGPDREIIRVADSVIMRPFEPSAISTYRDSAFHLEFEQCQSLMNELWNMGVRPTNEGTIGVSEAQTKHLNDLRKIVFKTLKIES